jgi:RNA polymerase sigma factor (TIGR02999 family)
MAKRESLWHSYFKDHDSPMTTHSSSVSRASQGDVTQLLDALVEGEKQATSQLFPLVYDELRSMAQRMMRSERDGHTLQTTGLIHEAYLRLVNQKRPQGWAGRGHFFGAAAEAMRRILVEHARRKLGKMRGGDLNRLPAGAAEEVALAPESQSPEFILEVHDALDSLERVDPQAAKLVKLKFFAGFSIVDAAELMGISKTTAYALWAYAKATLAKTLADGRADSLG